MAASVPSTLTLRTDDLLSSTTPLKHYHLQTVNKLKVYPEAENYIATNSIVNHGAKVSWQARKFEPVEILCKEGRVFEAVQLLNNELKPINADSVDCLIQSCRGNKSLEVSRQVYCQIERWGFISDSFVASNVIRMFAFNGSLDDANKAFTQVASPDAFSWSAIISANSKNGQNKEAIRLYYDMKNAGIDPDGHVFVAVLLACGNTGSYTTGKQIHADVVRWNFMNDVKVGNSLITMYYKCGHLDDALLVFNQMHKRDVVTWTAMIQGCAEIGSGCEAFSLYDIMLKEGFEPNSVTYLNLLKACDISVSVNQGTLIHAEILKKGFESDWNVGSALVFMYANKGCIDDAFMVFNRVPRRNIVTWNTMIGACAQNGQSEKALQMFEKMQLDGLKPNKITFICLMKSCTNPNMFEQASEIHHYTIESGFELEVSVANALIDMYNKCESILEARKLFDKLPNRDVITWSTMIYAYSQHEQCQESILLFHDMQHSGVEPNQSTFVSVIKACTQIAALDHGILIHACAVASGFESDTLIGNSIVTLYAKCGSIINAETMFSRLKEPDVVSWNAMIAAYALYNDYESSLSYFLAMQKAGCDPDEVTFVCLLSACSHKNLINEGWHHYNEMVTNYGLATTVQHVVCMVDLLGRAGRLSEAEAFLEDTPFASSAVGWKSLLFNCRRKGDVEVAERCFKQLRILDPTDPAIYVLMSNIYSDAGMFENAERVEELKKQSRVWKKPAKAFIEINKKVHSFVVGDRSHPQSDEIYAKLKSTVLKMNKKVTSEDAVLLPGMYNEGSTDSTLCGHCEKLAVALGLISTPMGTTIRVSKNLRMCNNCHDTMKFISSAEKREILITDTYCVHWFKEGLCSCKET